jgi:hypothetical protein
MADMVIGINGPGGAGKSWFARRLVEWLHRDKTFKKRITIVETGPTAYEAGRKSGFIVSDLPYTEFKELVGGRDAVIRASRRMRRENPFAIVQAIQESDAYQNNDIVIVDNFGLDIEPDYFAQHCKFCSTLRINNVYDSSRIYTSVGSTESDLQLNTNEDFPGDCRRFLPITNGWDGIDSADLFNRTLAVIEYAIHGEEIGSQCRITYDSFLFLAGLPRATIDNWKFQFMG